MKVWAFNWTTDAEMQRLVYESLQKGKSRFGWSKTPEHNLLLEDNWSVEHGNQLFLLRIKPNDWIVHVNTPKWGRCVAARVTSEYGFDSGLNGDFRHCFDVDTDSILEFDRNDKNVLPSVNLKPRGRYHRVYAEDDFKQSIDNLRKGSVELESGESRQEHHLKGKTEQYLRGIPKLIHKMHRRKDLEPFLAKLFARVPGVDHVHHNGSGWGTDHGADLIITMSQSIGGYLQLPRMIVVQAKSYEGKQWETDAVRQIQEAIEHFDADAGMIVTTAEKTEALEQAVAEACKETKKPIDLLAADDLSRFIIKHAPDLIFRM